MAASATPRVRTARSGASKKAATPVADPMVVEMDFKPSSGARFVYDPEDIPKIVMAFEGLHAILSAEFLAEAKTPDIVKVLVDNGYTLSTTSDPKYGALYEGPFITLTYKKTLLRLSVVVTKDSIKADFRTYYETRG